MEKELRNGNAHPEVAEALKRPTVALSREVMDLMEQGLGQNPNILALLFGVREGRQLKGDYEVKITAAELRPK